MKNKSIVQILANYKNILYQSKRRLWNFLNGKQFNVKHYARKTSAPRDSVTSPRSVEVCISSLDAEPDLCLAFLSRDHSDDNTVRLLAKNVF